MSVILLFPHQLIQESVLPEKNAAVYLVEELLFFTQYKFHKQKLVFHRASMKAYEKYLKKHGYEVNYIEATESRSDVRILIEELASENARQIHYFDTTDNWLEKRITGSCMSYDVKLVKHPSPIFLNSSEENKEWLEDKKDYSQTSFYIEQRKRKSILVNDELKPDGGKWTFDTENRLRYPKNKIAPSLLFPNTDAIYAEAVDYVKKCFQNNPGEISSSFIYPYTYEMANEWLQHFLEYRFAEFGIYEDAIVANQPVLHHSVLSPLLNTGLILPQELVQSVLKFGLENDIPFNSIEGFIRQVIGWREFIRLIYEKEGTHQRNKNFWKFKKKMPASFYNGTTGIVPFDKTIKKVLSTGYCHHIERLMILGNFMLLCEINPDEVYEWFMELFIDAYDWVMVPNLYGMSQFADGGLMSTKPYISGSNYILKMSDYTDGAWCEIWDSLFWRFLHVHRSFFLTNPRLAMLVKSFDKMAKEKQQHHLETAETFLHKLHNV